MTVIKPFDVARCTSREVLAEVLPLHEEKNHSLAMVKEGATSAYLVFECSCASSLQLDEKTVYGLFDCHSDVLVARMRAFGKVPSLLVSK